jgi:CubicO group peptidase (beta-lactamase class C family)
MIPVHTSRGRFRGRVAGAVFLVTTALVALSVRRAWADATASHAPRVKEKTPQVIARLQRLIPELLQEGDVPGLAVALVRDGKLAWSSGFGVKNAKTREPVDDDTVFEAASLGKPVFAYAVLQLVDAGKLDLDRPLRRYWPGGSDESPDPRVDQVTARHVLSHTSGFPNWRNGPLKIHFVPGERFSYSGEGFVYLSRVVEHITGEPVNELITRTVFAPLGMKNSSYAWRAAYNDTKTSYHNTRGEPALRRPPTAPQEANVAAGLHTTAQDYGRFLEALLKGSRLKGRTRRLMLTPQAQVREGGATTIERPDAPQFPRVEWGLGWGLQTTAAGVSFFHWGNNGDAKAYVVAGDAHKQAVVVFTNSVYGLSIVPEILAQSVSGEQPALAWLRVESYRAPGRRLFRSLVARGAPAALADYREWRQGRPAEEVVNEDQMNRFGLDLLRMGRVDDAIPVLKQNVADYPRSFNVYDSLAEAYAVAGERKLAIENYERSIELNPANKGGIDALRALREGP